ncbi:hypothetical protein [Priestia megaterium]|uniref:hypothetical protein n=1 Tax=Priestia megaterium TaxID=1404 RepID=UPI002E24C6BB|nr:hypothetical protein [Priestia megaterium]
MAIINLFSLNTAEQLDLFYTESGALKLNDLRDVMIEKRAPIGNNGAINGEGFINPNFQIRNEVQVIESYCSSQGSLGYYNEARMVNESFTTERIQHHYYGKSFIIITQESDFIIKFDYAIEEGTKNKVKSLIEELGFEATIFRLDNDLLRKVQNHYDWSAAKLDKIERFGDSTKRVSYEIDPADDQHPSQVDEDYREHGKMSHITFELPYDVVGAPNTITVKLYTQGNRVVIDEGELGGSPIEEFILYLLGELKALKREE